MIRHFLDCAKVLGAFGFGFYVFSSEADACGFNEVLAGFCPAEIAESEMLKEGDLDRAAIYKAYTWPNYSEFKKLPKSSQIELQVCLFRGPAVTVADWSGDTFDFADNSKLFEKVGGAVEVAASPWTKPKGKTLAGVPVSNRLIFKFKDDNGKILTCENHPKSHIFVAMNTSKTNFSTVGFRGLKSARSGSKPKATMTLSMNASGGIASDVVLHEFGHALGYLHEMANAGWKDCADAFLAEQYVQKSGVTFGKGYTHEQQVELAKKNIQVLWKTYEDVSVGSEAFDRSSIMTYRIEERFFDKAKKAQKGLKTCGVEKDVKSLSNIDKSWFLSFYGTTQ